MTVNAMAMAIRYWVKVMGVKEKARFSAGMNMTAAVTSRENASVSHSMPFCFSMENREATRERMLKEWKISIMLSVRNAMVMPTLESAIIQRPCSILQPTKKLNTVTAAMMNPWKMMSKARPPLKMLSFLSRGGRCMTSFSASSMPSAMAGKVSVIRLIQRMCTGLRMEKPISVAANTASTSARFADSRNCMALRMLS